MPQVMRLLNRVFSKSLDADGRRALNSMGGQSNVLMRLSQWGSKVAPGFVWEMGNQMVGNVSIIPTQVMGRIIIANVAVHEDYRRRGIARALMEAAISHLDDVGTQTVLLQVDVDNHGAEQLYRSLGFREMGSTTLWLAAPGQWKELARDDRYDIRPMRGSEHQHAYQVDSESYPVDLNWPDPINQTLYRYGFFRAIDDFLNGRSREVWVVPDEKNQPAAVGAIWSEWSRPHRITMRVPEDLRNELTNPLFSKLLRRLAYLRRRHISIEHPMDDAVMGQLLEAANFSPKRHLKTMKLTFT